MKKKHYFRFVLTAAVLLFGIGVSAQDFTVDGIVYHVMSETDMTCEVAEDDYYAGYSGDVVIPAQVTTDGKTYTVTAVGEDAFFADEVNSVTLPNTVTEIKDGAFYMCSSLTYVDLGGNVRTIGDSAFAGCPLTGITLPSTLERVGMFAFHMSKLAAVELPPSLKEIGISAFTATALTSVVIPNSVTEVGDGAFLLCDLKSAVVGNSVNTIDALTFAGCQFLEDVTIGSSVTEILAGAFQSCINLKTVTVMCAVPPTINSNPAFPYAPDPVFPFKDVPIGKATLRVPAGSISAYKDAETWRDFGTIVEYTPTDVNNVDTGAGFTVKAADGMITVSGAEGEVSVYDVSGTKVAGATSDGGVTIAVPTHGIYIVKVGCKTVKVSM